MDWLRRLLPAAALSVLFVGLAAIPLYRWGVAAGRKQVEDSFRPGNLTIPPELTAELDAALIELRNGDPAKALATLITVREAQSRYPSVSYLGALAAVQVGDKNLAANLIKETIAKRERVSDALALRAVLESMRPDKAAVSLGDPKVRAEEYLRQAILADPANAAPHFELATLLRYTNRRDEARKEIRAAQARLNPVDAHTVTEVTLALMDLEDKSDEELPAVPAAPRNLSDVFGGAYTAMRKGDAAQAKALLKTGRAMASPDIFSYLVNDPALLRYRDSPELADFWP